MSNVYSDLEEGEIIDDSPSTFPSPKIKKLPRRYNFKENKNRHKKGCKHAIRHHAKKLAKLKNAPGKRNVTHSPHKSYSHVRFVDKCSKQGNNAAQTKRFSSRTRYSPSLTEKNHPTEKTKLKPSLDLSKFKPENFRSASDVVKEIQSCSFPEISAMYKEQSEKLKKSNSTLKLTTPTEVKQPEINIAVPIEAVKPASSPVKLKSDAAEKEESEDEEELRRIALSTCLTEVPKKQTISSFTDIEIVDNFANQILNNSNSCTENLLSQGLNDLPTCMTEVPKKQTINSFPNIGILDHFVPQSLQNNILCTNYSESQCLKNNSLCVPNYIDMMGADNNEVVDMELDEDNEKSLVSSSDIFIIDTKPTSEIPKNSDAASKENLSSDDDFEADMLRAELIENMYGQKSSSDEVQNDNQHVKANGVPETSLGPKAKSIPQNANSKLVKKPEINGSQKRLIISLNAESSSEESEDDDACDAVPVLPENPVASIEAFISDIRHKSDSNEKASHDVKVVPKSVSCLSRAQQEEYNALMKILAKKEKVLPVPQGEEMKKKPVHSAMNDLKILEKKLAGVTETLKRKKGLLKRLMQEVAEQKRLYMKSKLTAQLLKEQYIAAEKVRRVKLQALSKSSKRFEALKTSVSQLETKTSHLKSLCSRVGSCISGLNYSLPSVSTGS